MNVAFRVDVSLEMGTGHFMRCLTLADGMRQPGALIRFVSRRMPEYLQDMLNTKEHEFIQLKGIKGEETAGELLHAHWLGVSQAQDAADTSHALSDRTWDWLVVDHYALDARWETMLRNAAKRIFVIDDIADRQHDCDVLLDQNLYANMEFRYIGKVPVNCQLLLGPRYALLRDEFHSGREQERPRIGPVKRVLVFFGGVDADNFTSRAITALANIGSSDMHVDVVIGAQHPCRTQIESVCAECGFVCYVQTSRMAELMAAADLAIGAGGSATWERCCLGLPTIVFTLAKNQEETSRALANYGAVYLVENEMSDDAIKSAIEYLAVSSRLHEMSVKAAQLVDGQGALRLVDVLFHGACQ